MIPILYTAEERRFITNGIGRLSDCTRCIVTEERNGIYELELDYPLSGEHFEDIQRGRIIAVTHDDKHDIQPFVIYGRTVPDLNGIVTFYAHHISYKLSDIVVMPYSAGSVAAALNGIGTNSVNENPFTFWTDKTTVATFNNTVPRLARNMLGGEQNSILDVYGGGEYEFDRFEVKLYAHRGTDSDVEIRYAKNLTDLKQDIDESGTYNAIVPYWTNGEEIVTLDPPMIAFSGGELQTAYLTDHNLIIIRTESDEPIEVAFSLVDAAPMDLSSEFEEKPTQSQLRAAAIARYNNSDAAAPSENIKVDFVQLWQTEEYKDFAALQRVSLCDTVSVYYPQAGIEAVKQKVVKVVYNALLDRYDSIELGQVQTSLGQAIRENIMQDVATTSMMDAAINYATDLIRGGLGGYVVMTPGANGYPQEILIMDSPSIDEAVNVWRFNQGGLGHSSNGYQGPFSDIALTQDGKINASMITTGTLNADYIKAGTLASEDGENSWDLASGELTAGKGTIGGFSFTSSRLRNENRYGDFIQLYSNGIWIHYEGTDGVFNYTLSPDGDGLRLRLTPTGGSAADCPQIRPHSIRNLIDDDYYPEAIVCAKNAIRLGSFADCISGSNPLTIFEDEPAFISGSSQSITAKVLIQGATRVSGDFTVSGTKNRAVGTDNYSERLLYCYETPTPLFGDIGEAVIDSDGFCYVDIDDIFSETIAERVEYQVFLQAEGEGTCYVAEKHSRYFVIKGTPNLKVAWELKAKQKDYELTRLEQSENKLDEYGFTYETDLLNDYIKEQEDLLYGYN